MKEEINLVLVTEDAEVKAIMCEGIRFIPDEKETITTAHASLRIREDQTPKELKLPFNIDRWRANDFVKVVTRDGREVTKLTDFEVPCWPLNGVVDGQKFTWTTEGRFHTGNNHHNDLFLIVKQ